ncbi:MAG: MmcQ/YjbR family DNA-binding protein [Clostridia bacterium]|nr:MmcQ/YjbR family DNA-binding protein [Clostridia bacterium]
MKTRKEAIAACMDLPFVYEDYPFHDENWTVMRHRENQKTFALIFEHAEKMMINVKAEPQAAELWRQVFPSVIPAYHMNKTHWISIILDGTMPDEEIIRLIGDSYRLTAARPKKSRKTE